MKRRRAYKYLIYPNKQQQQLAVKFGHACFIFNCGFDARKKAFKKTAKGLSHTATAFLLPNLKQELPWLKKADSQIYLPKVGWVTLVLHRPTEGVLKNTTVLKTKSGKYFVSVQCEFEICEFSNNMPAVDVDLGLHYLPTLSIGEKIEHPTYSRAAEKKFRRLRKALSRTKKGSDNRAKARCRVAVLHEKIANQRSDFFHKLSNRLVRSHGIVSLEDLNVAGMVKYHSLAKSISDSGLNTFKLQCEYEACQYGAGVQSVDRFFPSSKTCNVCAYVNNDLKLQHRFRICPECSAEDDRDINAAINIHNLNTVGATERQACGEDVRPISFLGGRLNFVKQEAQCLQGWVAHKAGL